MTTLSFVLSPAQIAQVIAENGGVTPPIPVPPAADPIPKVIEGLKVRKFQNITNPEKFGPQAALGECWAVYNDTGVCNTSSIFEDGGGQKQPRALFNLKAGQLLPAVIPWLKGPSQIHGWDKGDIVLFKAVPDFTKVEYSFSSIKCQHEG